MEKTEKKHEGGEDPQTDIRLQLIIAMGGDVLRAETALAFVNGNPEASETYRRFKEWEKERYVAYSSNGLRPEDFP